MTIPVLLRTTKRAKLAQSTSRKKLTLHFFVFQSCWVWPGISALFPGISAQKNRHILRKESNAWSFSPSGIDSTDNVNFTARSDACWTGIPLEGVGRPAMYTRTECRSILLAQRHESWSSIRSRPWKRPRCLQQFFSNSLIKLRSFPFFGHALATKVRPSSRILGGWSASEAPNRSDSLSESQCWSKDRPG